jgi:hypothetical protein
VAELTHQLCHGERCVRDARAEHGMLGSHENSYTHPIF